METNSNSAAATVYVYNKTQQISKTTSELDQGSIGEPVAVTTTQAFEYDLQGRMTKSTTTKVGGIFGTGSAYGQKIRTTSKDRKNVLRQLIFDN